MSEQRGRTNPPGNDEGSDSGDDVSVCKSSCLMGRETRLTISQQHNDAFSTSATGRFRSKVVDYQNQSQVDNYKIHMCKYLMSDQCLLGKFPTSPVYSINDEVYLIIAGQPQPSGPYLITAILANRRYKLKRKDTGEAMNQPVGEDDLLVRTS